MKILLLHKYAHKSASFRYRFEQYLPYLKEQGYDYQIESLLSDAYLQHRFKTGKRNLIGYLKPLLHRLSLFWRVKQFDLVIIGVEFLPYFPAIFERYLKWLKIPYIFDYDDAIFHYYDLSKNPLIKILFAKKFNTVLTNASHIMAGSPYLVEYSKKFNTNVNYLPTVVNPKYYNRTKIFSNNRQIFIIGWIGSPSTATYLHLIAPALKNISQRYSIKLVLIGAGNFFMNDINLELKDWSEQHEITELLDFDVGIMPLTNDNWSQGKCGFKLIQYMACGLPVIASPVGVNCDMVKHGKNGFLADTQKEWQHALQLLIEDSHLCKTMGYNGRTTFEKNYSLDITAPQFIDIIKHETFNTRTTNHS